MNSVNLNIKSVEVKSETRALKVEWTRELATDISQFAGFDTEYFERVLASEYVKLKNLKRRESRKKSINKIFKN